jgi:hypothetical protein
MGDVIPFKKNGKLEQIEKMLMAGESRESIEKFQELARKQGASQEEIDKIPAMLAAVVAQATIKDYSGPTDEEVNPDFFK